LKVEKKQLSSQKNYSTNDNIQTEKLRNDLKIKNRYSWLIVAISILSLLIFSYTLLTDKVDIDGITLLSFILAFFSIYLSATFYFKATEQSNQFYDRSYSHTKDIAESLSSMRGEFGKSLTLLEQHNASLHQRMDSIPWVDLKEKRESLSETQQERDALIDELLTKAGLQSDERKEYEEKLNKYELTISDLKKEINNLRKVNNLDLNGHYADSREDEDMINTMLFFFVDNEIYRNRINNGEDINKVFSDFMKILDSREKRLLISYGIISEDHALLKKGLSIISNMM
jgi:ABC-type multidrug transport system fused ATPase/permease subunit